MRRPGFVKKKTSIALEQVSDNSASRRSTKAEGRTSTASRRSTKVESRISSASRRSTKVESPSSSASRHSSASRRSTKVESRISSASRRSTKVESPSSSASRHSSASRRSTKVESPSSSASRRSTKADGRKEVRPDPLRDLQQLQKLYLPNVPPNEPTSTEPPVEDVSDVVGHPIHVVCIRSHLLNNESLHNTPALVSYSNIPGAVEALQVEIGITDLLQRPDEHFMHGDGRGFWRRFQASLRKIVSRMNAHLKSYMLQMAALEWCIEVELEKNTIAQSIDTIQKLKDDGQKFNDDENRFEGRNGGSQMRGQLFDVLQLPQARRREILTKAKKGAIFWAQLRRAAANCRHNNCPVAIKTLETTIEPWRKSVAPGKTAVTEPRSVFLRESLRSAVKRTVKLSHEEEQSNTLDLVMAKVELGELHRPLGGSDGDSCTVATRRTAPISSTRRAAIIGRPVKDSDPVNAEVASHLAVRSVALQPPCLPRPPVLPRRSLLATQGRSANVSDYLRFCQDHYITPQVQDMLAPSPSPVEMNFSRQQASDYTLTSMLSTFEFCDQIITNVNLSHNKIVDGVIAIFDKVFPAKLQGNEVPSEVLRRQPLEGGWTLDALDLSNNPLSSQSVKYLARIIQLRHLNARKLNVSCIRMNAEELQALTLAISKNGKVKEVVMANAELGYRDQYECQLVAQLCNSSVDALDFSYNYFKRGGLLAIGSYLSNSSATAKSLSLANNVWASVPAALGAADFEYTDESPLNYLCEAIGENTSLTCLDLSGCYLEQRAAICLEDALWQNSSLTSLNLNQNPLGTTGLRSILRAVAREHSAIGEIFVSEVRESPPDPKVLYNPVDLLMSFEGETALNLEFPYHRSVLRLLLRRIDVMQLVREAVFQNVTIDGEAQPAHALELGRRAPPNGKRARASLLPDSAGLSWCPRGGEGARLVRREGKAAFVYSVTNALDHHHHKKASAEVYLLHHYRRTRVSLHKFIVLLRLWKEQKVEHERLIFLRAMVRDMHYSLGQAMAFVLEITKSLPASCPKVVAHIVCTLQNPDLGSVVSMLKHSSHTIMNEKLCYVYTGLPAFTTSMCIKAVSKLVRLNLNSLTGRHLFCLDNPADYAALDRFFVAMHWEASTAREKGCVDCSEVGNHFGVRNFSYDNQIMPFTPNWELPGDGFQYHANIAFDYITPILPSHDFIKKNMFTRGAEDKAGCCMGGGCFEEFLSLIRGDATDASMQSKLLALQSCSDRVLVNASQMHSILKVLTYEWREEFYIMLFARCIDYGSLLNDRHNGVLGDPHLFDSHAILRIDQRIGPAHTFDLLNVHSERLNHYRLDLTKRDQRLVCNAIIKVGQKEMGAEAYKGDRQRGHIQDVVWSEGSLLLGTFDLLPWSWYTQGAQSHGEVSFVYRLDKYDLCLYDERIKVATRMFGWVLDETRTFKPVRNMKARRALMF